VSTDSTFDETEWRARIEEHRRRKDAFFADHEGSPLPHERRHDFDGLDYYPPDPDYRVVATVTRHDDPEELVVETTTGDELVVDFNVAYSPFCAYNDAYSCPLPLTENWLDVPIAAGERHEGDGDH